MSLLSVNFMGLPLKNPIIAAAGPWCRDAAAMQKAIDAGASFHNYLEYYYNIHAIKRSCS